jgi:site-specific DNA-cytosine methylase
MYKGQIPTWIKKPLRVGTIKQGSQGDRIYSVEAKGITLSAQSGGTASNGNMLIQVGTADDIKGHDILKRVYSTEGKAPTLNTCSGGNREPKVIDVRATRERRTEEGKRIRKEYKEKYGIDHTPFRAKETVIKDDQKANTLTTASTNESLIRIEDFKNKFLWRKLTPTECEALQTVDRGYTDHVSNTQRYRMLGNGWTVDVIGHILKPLLEDQKVVSIKPKEEE